ncbi:MAG: ATP-binding protein [Promicromonosporaceae bacterium]|nr:ATP-binding protein [Promicromonosporaceae bacterium]
MSQNLYSSPAVVIRELIQNAHDAIRAREQLGNAAVDRRVEISPLGVSTPLSAADEFTITDHGIGVAHDEVEALLATVGGTSKMSDLGKRRRTYLGQFGIGLLSCFLVADQIVVTSTSAKTGETIEWTGRSNGTYTVRDLPSAGDPGTTVRLIPRPEMSGWLQSSQVQHLARKYAEFLPIELSVSGGGGLISRAFPWDVNTAWQLGARKPETPTFAGLGLGRKTDSVTIRENEAPEIGMSGALYFDETGRGSGQKKHRIYQGGMLVDDSDGNLLPDWAFFAQAVINSTLLEPTASREAIVANLAYQNTSEYLTTKVLGWLRDMGESSPERFTKFVNNNLHPLKMAIIATSKEGDLALAEVVVPLLFLETNGEPLRIADIVHHNPEVLYTDSQADFQALLPFAPPGRLVVNAGYSHDHEILELIPMLFPGATIQRLSPLDTMDSFGRPAGEVDEEARGFAKRAQRVLAARLIPVKVRDIPAPEMPTVLVEGTGLIFNWSNRLVRALALTEDEVVFPLVVQLLYTQARLAVDPTSRTDRETHNQSLNDLMSLAVGLEGWQLSGGF